MSKKHIFRFSCSKTKQKRNKKSIKKNYCIVFPLQKCIILGIIDKCVCWQKKNNNILKSQTLKLKICVNVSIVFVVAPFSLHRCHNHRKRVDLIFLFDTRHNTIKRIENQWRTYNNRFAEQNNGTRTSLRGNNLKKVLSSFSNV